MTPDTNPSPVTGILWMVTTGLFFVGVTAMVKTLGPVLPAAEAAFIRYGLGLVLLVPLIPRLRSARLTPRHWRLLGFRAAAHTMGVVLWFYAMARIAIADVTAMNYLSPVYVSIAAALFLGETMHWRRIMAVIAAVLGALIILRPGFREVGMGHLAMLFAAVFFAASYIFAKKVSDELPPAVVLAGLSIGVALGLAPLAVANWVWPDVYMLAMLFGVACLASAGHYTMTLAFRAAPLTVTQPVTFLQLVWAVALGALVFGEPVDPYVLLGGGVILSSVVFLTWREAVLKRRRVIPAVNEGKL